MARTQAADYGQKREAILDAAATLFAREGFRGVSVADLAAACATSKSLIYHYYPSKEDILHAVMASHIDQLSRDVDAAMASGADAGPRLRTLVHSFMTHYVGAAARQKVLLNELDRLPTERRTAIVGQQRAIIRAVAQLFGQLDPRLAADPARATARAMMLFGMINWTHTWYDPAGPIEPDEIADLAYGLATGASPQAS